MEIDGQPLQAFLGQLLLGLVNGSFYAMLSLGLAVIFGLLGIVNFAHGALYMVGAYVACVRPGEVRHQLLGGARPRAAGRRRDRRRHRAHAAAPPLPDRPDLRAPAHLRPGADRRGRCSATSSASPASPTRCPSCCRAPPTSASWSCRTTAPGWSSPRSSVCLGTWFTDRAHPPRRDAARRHREPEPGAGLRHQRAADGDAHLRRRRRPRRARRRARRAGDPGRRR